MWNLPIEDIHKLIKSIIILRSKVGATIADIQADFINLIGERLELLHGNIKDAINFLRQIDGVYFVLNEHGNYYWYVSSKNTMHIQNMITNQKPEKFIYKKYDKTSPYHNNGCTGRDTGGGVGNANGGIHYLHQQNKCFFKDNYFYKFNRRQLVNMKFGAYFYNYQLMGDDYFLSLAKSELDCMYTPGCQILQSGLCKSGLTIKEAINRIQSANYIDSNIIINVGSVDLLHGRDLIDLQYDFEMLIQTFEKRGILPIITTLAPIGNICHLPDMRYKLEKFNNYIKENFYFVIDLTECFVNQSGHILFDCYQADARYVTGSNRPHLLWNRIGRQRILKFLKRKIAEIQTMVPRELLQ